MAATGTLTETPPNNADRFNRPIQKFSYAWTSDSSGNVERNTTSIINGTLVNIEVIPASGGSAPSASWDLVIKDSGGFDVLSGGGANLSESAATRLKPHFVQTVDAVDYPFDVCVYESLQVLITNAGDSNSGTLVIYVR